MLIITLVITASFQILNAQEKEVTGSQNDAAELAKKLSNPISSLISVPFQNNSDYGIGDAVLCGFISLKNSKNGITWGAGPVFLIPSGMNDNREAKTTVLWFNPLISGVAPLGSQKVQLAFGPRFNLASPDKAKADWGWRAAVVFLFPKK